MKFINKKKLSALLDSLQSHDLTIQRCLKAYKDQGLLDYTAGSKVPTKEAYEVYKRRSEYPPDEGQRQVSGYNSMLENLKFFDEESVKIHSFGRPDETFIVFTDCAISRLLGVLVSEKLSSNTDVES